MTAMFKLPSRTADLKAKRFPWYRMPLEIQQAILSGVLESALINPISAIDNVDEDTKIVITGMITDTNVELVIKEHCDPGSHSTISARFGDAAARLLEFEKGTPGILAGPIARCLTMVKTFERSEYKRAKLVLPQPVPGTWGEPAYMDYTWERSCVFVRWRNEEKVRRTHHRRFRKSVPLLRAMLWKLKHMAEKLNPKGQKVNWKQVQELHDFRSGKFVEDFFKSKGGQPDALNGNCMMPRDYWFIAGTSIPRCDESEEMMSGRAGAGPIYVSLE